MYDVLIAGASFAGLALANQLQDWRILLVDKGPIGGGQTSACGTIFDVLQYWDLTETALQIHHNLVLHTNGRDILFPSPYPWCTFDYERLCLTLFERSGGEYLQATVLGIDDQGKVLTSRGEIRARYQSFVNDRRHYFSFLSWAQGVLTQAPLPWIDHLARLVQSKPFRPRVFEWYRGLTGAWSKQTDVYETTDM